jgi:hypothetical protein
MDDKPESISTNMFDYHDHRTQLDKILPFPLNNFSHNTFSPSDASHRDTLLLQHLRLNKEEMMNRRQTRQSQYRQHASHLRHLRIGDLQRMNLLQLHILLMSKTDRIGLIDPNNDHNSKLAKVGFPMVLMTKMDLVLMTKMDLVLMMKMDLVLMTKMDLVLMTKMDLVLMMKMDLVLMTKMDLMSMIKMEMVMVNMKVTDLVLWMEIEKG